MAHATASRCRCRAAIATAAVLLVAGPVAAEPEAMPPGTRQAMHDGDVVPTSLTSAAGGDVAPVAGHPLPLDAGAPTSGDTPRSATRPLPDWRLLAALAAAFAAVGGYRLMAGRAKATLPTDVFEVLGEASLGTAHSVRVVRFGPRTLLVSVSNSGCQTLAELTDPQATDCIVAACRGPRPRAAAALAAGGRGRPAVPAIAEVRG